MMLFQHLPIQVFQHWLLLNEVTRCNFVLLMVMVGVGEFNLIKSIPADRWSHCKKDRMPLWIISSPPFFAVFHSQMILKGIVVNGFFQYNLEPICRLLHWCIVFFNPVFRHTSSLAEHFLRFVMCGLHVKFLIVTLSFYTTDVKIPLCQSRNLSMRYLLKRGICLFTFVFAWSYLWIPLYVPIGEALNPGPSHDLLHVNVINPTALLGKVDAITALGKGIHCISESSVTNKAQYLIRNDCRRLKQFVQFSAMADPHIHGTLHDVSLRGAHTGCAVLSNHHVFQAFNDVDPKIWVSGRILDVLVPVNAHCTIRILVVYLPAKSQGDLVKLQQANCIMNEVFKRLLSSSLPTMIVGDFNIECEHLESCALMYQHGMRDLACISFDKWGYGTEPTCRGKTRRTFAFGDPTILSMFHDAQVIETYDFDSHPVLKVRLRISAQAIYQSIWPHPKTFDDVIFDPSILDSKGKEFAYQIADAVDTHLHQGKPFDALKVWSTKVEDCFMNAACNCTGQRVTLTDAYKGRCNIQETVSTAVTPPRLRNGRPGDFSLTGDTATTKTRQWLKQTRRLRHLRDIFRHDGTHKQSHEIWTSILHATGFGRSFMDWIFNHHAILLSSNLPTLECVEILVVVMEEETAKLHSQRSSTMKACFKDALYDSFDGHGGDKAFAAIRENKLPDITHLHTKIKPKLKRVRWSGPTCRLRVDNPHNFHVGRPLQSEEDAWNIIAIQGDVLFLHKPIAYRDACKTFQKHVVHDCEKISSTLHDGWKQYWDRDPKQDDESYWTSMLQVVDASPSWDPLQLEPLNMHDWRYAMSNTKNKSMRGSDSWTAKELKQIPECMIVVLIAIYNYIERNANWPVELLQAFVVCLAKAEGELTWDLVRPITVTSMLYRVYGRMRTHRILKWIQIQVPKTIPDVAFSEATTLMWFRNIEQIQDAYQTNTPCVGAVFDLVKAFNTFGRLPLSRLAVHLGLDAKLVGCWFDALSKLTRRFIIQGSLSKPFGATTGVPEGCGLSVVAVALLSYMFLIVVRAIDRNALPSAYADNWGLQCNTVHTLQRCIDAIADFCQRARLIISVPKSWVWASHPKERKQLKLVTLQGCTLPVVKKGTDLGADMRYSCAQSIKLHESRCHKGILRLRRLHRLPISRHYKKRLLRQGVWPQALHGAEAIKVCATRLKRLRSAAAEALGHRKCSQNPWLSLGLSKTHPNDPEFYLIMQRIRLVRYFAEHVRNGYELVCRRLSQNACKYTGPIRHMKDALAGIGWKNEGPSFKHECGQSVNILKDSYRYILGVMSDAWRRHICKQVQHRKLFQGLSSIETFDDQIGKYFKPNELALYENLRAGALVTNDILSKFTQCENKCPACQTADSMEHRLFECEYTLPLRKKFEKYLETWKKLPPFTRLFGLFQEATGIPKLSSMLQQIPFPNLDLYSCDKVDVYIDGSCAHPANRRLRYAAWAVTLACKECTECPNGNLTVASGPLPGVDQCILRAEICAGIVACAKFPAASIYSDNATFVKHANYFILAKNQGFPPSIPDCERDLWMIFWRVLNFTSLSPDVIKVKAHQNLNNLQGCCYTHALHNMYADQAAKDALLKFPRNFLMAHQRCLKQYETDRNIAIQLAKFHVEAALQFLQIKKAEVSWNPKSITLTDLVFSDPVQRFVIPPVVNLKVKMHDLYVASVVEWLQTLCWHSDVSNCKLRDVSWLELLYFFRTEKKMDLVMVPKYTQAMKRQGIWKFDFASRVANENLPSALAINQVKVFISCVQALEKNLKIDILPQPRVRRCCSTVAFGSKSQFGGIQARPANFDLDRVNVFAKFVQSMPKKNPLRVHFNA